MNQTYTQWLIGAVVLIVILVGGYFLWKQSSPTLPATTISTSTPATSTSTVSLTTTGASAGYTTHVISDTNSPAPSASPADFIALIALGTTRKNTGDYAGAAAAWTQAAQLVPSSYVPFANLGDLFMNFVHDYPKAESSYLMAIKNGPTQAVLYGDLFTLYTTTTYNPSASAAENILKQGIAANPNAVELRVMLARYYKSYGRTADAKTQYDAAIASANAQGETTLSAQISAEENQ